LSLPDVQAVLALPLDQAAEQLQIFVSNAAREPEQAYSVPGYVPRTQSVISHPGQSGSGQNLRSINALNGILQSDGPGANADTSDEDEDDDDEDDEIDELDDDKEDLDKDEEEDAGQDEVFFEILHLIYLKELRKYKITIYRSRSILEMMFLMPKKTMTSSITLSMWLCASTTR